MAAIAFADDTVYDAVSNFTKEGDAMDKFLGNLQKVQRIGIE